MLRYKLTDEYIRKLEEKLQSLGGVISAEKYQEIAAKIDEIKRLGIELPDNFDVTKIDSLTNQIVDLETTAFSSEFVEESAKEIKRVAFLQKLQYLLNCLEEHENVSSELKEEEQYWHSIEEYYDEIESREIRGKLDEIHLLDTLRKIREAKVVNIEEIGGRQNYFLLRERLQRLAKSSDVSEKEKLLINGWLGESVGMKSAEIDEAAMGRIVRNPKFWSVLTGVKDVSVKQAKEVPTQVTEVKKKAVGEQVPQKTGLIKKGQESEERKREITALCEKYNISEKKVRDLLKRSKGDNVCFIEAKGSYKAVLEKHCCGRFFEGRKSKVRVVIYNNENYSGIDNQFGFVCDVVLPDYIKCIEAKAFMNCHQLRNIRLPVHLRKIGTSAFEGSGIESIELPDDLEFLGASVFASSKLSKIKLGKGLIDIPVKAFENCYLLTHIDIPSNIEVIKDRAFRDSALKSINFSDGLEIIGEEAFRDTKLETIQIPNSLKILKKYAFMWSQLKKVEFGTSIMDISEGVFAGCDLENINIPSNVRSIDKFAFQGNPLKKVILHEGLRTIRSGAFRETQLTSLALPNSVDFIDKNSVETSVRLTVGEIKEEEPATLPSLEELKKKRMELAELLAQIDERLNAQEQTKGQDLDK